MMQDSSTASSGPIDPHFARPASLPRPCDGPGADGAVAAAPPAGAADEIERLRAQVSQLQRLSSVGELAGTITHEFNNVLMTIINYAKLGLRHRDDATRDKSLEKILVASNRAARITGSVLALARNRPTLEPTNLLQLVDDSLLLLERELNKYRVAVDRHLTPVPAALANAGQIQQVLMNLLTNARQAMPGGGRVAVRLTYDPEANTVDLQVRDTGCGIPADVLPRIFEPYFTTKTGPDSSGKGGTGLGLSTCREIIEAHRGRIRVESAVGKGTSFTIKLPAAERPAAAVAANPAAGGVGLRSTAPA